MHPIDPTRCPICHEMNICAMEKAKATGSELERCWCVDAVFTPASKTKRQELAVYRFNSLKAWQMIAISRRLLPHNFL